MRVLMLGWEFPPYISGGLGTACYGLTRAMSARGTEVLFVLPRSVDADHADHVQIISPAAPRPRARTGEAARQPGNGRTRAAERFGEGEASVDHHHDLTEGPAAGMSGVAFQPIRSVLSSPYLTPAAFAAEHEARGMNGGPASGDRSREAASAEHLPGTRGGARVPVEDEPHDDAAPRQAAATDYTADIMTEVQRYAAMAARLTRFDAFDVIHAHDWMTYPAGLAIAGLTGKPLVVHVHSTEFDRSGDSVNQPIYDIERRGMHAATAVICVSHLTRKICELRYGVAGEKIHVVYNGIEHAGAAQPRTTIRKGDKIVLFLGRLTMQKGPEYFVAAAKKVLAKYERVKFIVAGSGDLAGQTVQLAAEMGIGHKVLFAGFLRGGDVERVFRMADVYVMPSVSEPFGIAPLEAIRHDVPVIISKNSGVAEVIDHALKVDFWDVDEMANKIIAVLRHPPLSQTLREHADFEVRALTWEGAAAKCVAVYEQAIAAMREDRPGPDASAPPARTAAR